MSIKDDIIKLINAVYRNDEFINAYTEAVATVFNSIIAWLNSVKANMFFDTLDTDGVTWWEAYLNITPKPSQTLSDRRAQIQAKYLSTNHNEILLIQRVCNAWQNGEVEADFVGGKIQLKFVASYGVPSDLDSLKEAIDEVKPAHLPLLWIYKYLLKKEIHHILTKSQMQTYKKHQYCDVKIGV